jgi:hypothetical protein
VIHLKLTPAHSDQLDGASHAPVIGNTDDDIIGKINEGQQTPSLPG